jgi:hypothetical protein
MPEPWEQLRDAHHAVGEIGRSLISAGIWQQQLRLALASPRGRATALSILNRRPAEEIMDLVDAVFDATVSMPAGSGLGEQVLAKVDPGWLSFALRRIVHDRVAGSPEPDAARRRIAELLEQLEQPSLLKDLVRPGAIDTTR